MVNRRNTLVSPTVAERSDHMHGRALDGQIDIQLLKTPDNRILHPGFVERNGWLHALASGTPRAEQAGALFAAPAYHAWIQDGCAMPG